MNSLEYKDPDFDEKFEINDLFINPNTEINFNANENSQLTTYSQSSSLESYINYINKIPLLTLEEEQNLLKAYHENNDLEAAKKIILAHLRVVVSVSHKYLGYGIPQADLIQEGTIGLMKAVKNFDKSHNVRFITYALYYIKASINEYVIKNWRLLKIATTRAHRKLFFKLRSSKKKLGTSTQEEICQLSKDLGVSEQDIKDMEYRLSNAEISLDYKESDDQSSVVPIDKLGDYSNEPSNIIEKGYRINLENHELAQAISSLDQRSKEIILNRWLNQDQGGMSLQELANRYKISAERVRQIEASAFQKLKKLLSKNKNTTIADFSAPLLGQ